MRRLATQIHSTVGAVLVLFAVLLGAAWWHGPGMRDEARLAEAVAETAGEVLPGPGRPAEELQAALERLARASAWTRPSSRQRATAWPGGAPLRSLRATVPGGTGRARVAGCCSR
jgi:hypothetical protein